MHMMRFSACRMVLKAALRWISANSLAACDSALRCIISWVCSSLDCGMVSRSRNTHLSLLLDESLRKSTLPDCGVEKENSFTCREYSSEEIAGVKTEKNTS